MLIKDKEDYLALLRRLVAVDSSTPVRANTLVDCCRDWLAAAGVSSRLIDHNGCRSLLAEVGSGGKTIILNGHLDVVAGRAEQFVPRERDGRLYGRGAADMKGGVAALLAVMARLRRQPVPARVKLQLVADEETGGANGTGYLVETGETGDFVICAEPTNLAIAVQAKGILQVDLTAVGRAAHGSRPWEGENAIIKAYRLLAQINSLPFLREQSPFYDGPSLNVARIAGGEVYNKVPDRCQVSLDIRYLPEQDAAEIRRQIEAVAGSVHVHAVGEPVCTSPADPYVRRLAAAAEAVTGRAPSFVGQHGSADTRYFARLGIPAVEFGPAGGNWHGDEEYVTVVSLEQYIEILWEFLTAP